MTAKTELRLVSRAERTTRTKVDTIGFTQADAEAWLLPAFQRPLRVNAKVLEIAEGIKADGGVMPGILTLGVINGKTYLVDGQHRREAFFQSGCDTGYADVRYCEFESMAEMADEFVRLNSQIVRLKPDDILRGLEAGNEHLRRLRKACPWIGYGFFRAGETSPIMGPARLVRLRPRGPGPLRAQHSGPRRARGSG